MKRIIIWVCLMAIVSGARAETKYREFESADGKVIRGCIKAYDPAKKMVTIERDNRRTTKVPITIFSEADQAYILEWETAKGFLSEQLLKISCKKKRGERRKEKQVEDVPTVGGGSEEIQLNEITFEKFAYEIQLQNMGKSPLDNMRAVYIIYYEQSDMALNKKPEVIQRYLRNSLSIPSLDSRQKVVLTTDEVEIHEDNVNSVDWSDGSVYVGGDGDIHGIRVRLYMKTASGKEIMREIAYPEKLSDEKFRWRE